MSNRDDDPGRVDWLDLGPDPDEGRTPPDPRRRYLWYGAAAALVVVALVLTRTQHGTNRAATSPRSPSATGTVSSSTSSRAPSSGSASSSGSFVDPPSPSLTAATTGLSVRPVAPVGPPKVTNLGHRLLDVPADWELFARGPGVMVRIQLALGRITTTAVPVSTSDVPVGLLVGSDRVLVRALDDTTGYVVRDRKQATELPPFLRQGVSMLPGPDQQHLWTNALYGDPNALALVTLDGKPTGVRIFFPGNASVLGPDGAGYLLLAGLGGIYDALPGGVQRVTTGTVLASGPTRWLAFECDDRLSCARVVIDRATRARHRLGSSAESTDQNPSSGTISPDGKTAALLLPSDGISSNGIQLVDLDSGADRAIDVTPSSTGGQLGPSWAWSPDSRWLFVTDDAGRVIIINRATGRASALGAQLPLVDHVALRHGTG